MRRRQTPGGRPGKQPPWGASPDGTDDWPQTSSGQTSPVRGGYPNPAPHSLKDQRGMRVGTTTPNRGYAKPTAQQRQQQKVASSGSNHARGFINTDAPHKGQRGKFHDSFSSQTESHWGVGANDKHKRIDDC